MRVRPKPAARSYVPMVTVRYSTVLVLYRSVLYYSANISSVTYY